MKVPTKVVEITIAFVVPEHVEVDEENFAAALCEMLNEGDTMTDADGESFLEDLSSFTGVHVYEAMPLDEIDYPDEEDEEDDENEEDENEED